jgi:hypothetical protein
MSTKETPSWSWPKSSASGGGDDTRRNCNRSGTGARPAVACSHHGSARLHVRKPLHRKRVSDVTGRHVAAPDRMGAARARPRAETTTRPRPCSETSARAPRPGPHAGRSPRWPCSPSPSASAPTRPSSASSTGCSSVRLRAWPTPRGWCASTGGTAGPRRRARSLTTWTSVALRAAPASGRSRRSPRTRVRRRWSAAPRASPCAWSARRPATCPCSASARGSGAGTRPTRRPRRPPAHRRSRRW